MVLPRVTSSGEGAVAPEAYEQRVLEVVRALALEVRGPRAMQAVTPTASLEREIGFGSLERVELLARLEAALGHELDDRFLLLDTAREIVAAALEAASRTAEHRLSRVVSQAPPVTALDEASLTSVVEALWLRAAADPARVHVYLEESSETRDVTFGVLRDGAASIAAGIAARGLRAGERVAIMLPTGFDFLQSFLGTMAAGLVPVPLYPPVRLDRMREYLLRQAKILTNAGARLLVTVPEAAPVADLLRREVPSLAGVVTVSALATKPRVASPVEPHAALPGDLALIQYTSGSTGDPKGVCLTYANLLANIRAIGSGVDVRPTDVGASWLPLYHDMGLIGTWLSSIVWGIPLALMSPLFFLARPERWLWAIHRHRATLSAAPNFAYELCLRKVRDEAIEGLDLSSWRCALNGSEPVSPSTVERFARRFEPYGFDPKAMMPVYGLAECAVALAFPPASRGVVVDRVARDELEREGRATPAVEHDPHALRFVSVGRPLAAHDIRIVDERDHEVGDRVVGRLVFRGPSAMTHYHDNPDATARAVRSDGWIESGDLAYRADGELFITGRAKDLIIKGGRNVMPQEIEDVAAGVDGIRKGCVAAFGVPDEATGTERLVVVAESVADDRDTRERLEATVIHAVAEATGLPPDIVVIVSPHAVPKTSSGKLRRAQTKNQYLAGQLGGSTKPPLLLRARLLQGVFAARMARGASRVGDGLFAAYLTVVGGVAAIVVGVPLRVLLQVLPGRRAAFSLARVASRLALRVAWSRVTVEGLERLPRKGPLVLVSNHASFADSVALVAALPLDFVF
ncbi:MAG TPA: AMP-binding protein, partial [Gemmatimonadaceae bacterium]|nr:AMP-binding protein [Gemmatimonadaceae bacterium]